MLWWRGGRERRGHAPQSVLTVLRNRKNESLNNIHDNNNDDARQRHLHQTLCTQATCLRSTRLLDAVQMSKYPLWHYQLCTAETDTDTHNLTGLTGQRCLSGFWSSLTNNWSLINGLIRSHALHVMHKTDSITKLFEIASLCGPVAALCSHLVSFLHLFVVVFINITSTALCICFVHYFIIISSLLCLSVCVLQPVFCDFVCNHIVSLSFLLEYFMSFVSLW